MAKFVLPVIITNSDKDPKCCSEACERWNTNGTHPFCGTECLDVAESGGSLRTEYCLTKAKPLS
jgi:hypothetical protein